MSDDVEEKLTKLHLNGEGFWVKKLGDDRYEVRNSCICNPFGFGDIITSTGEVIERKGRSVIINYNVDSECDIKEVYKSLVTYMDKENIGVEGFLAGVAGLTIPMDISKTTFLSILADAPVECTLKEEKQDE